MLWPLCDFGQASELLWVIYSSEKGIISLPFYLTRLFGIGGLMQA